MEFMAEHGYKTTITRLGVPDQFITHGTIPELYRLCGIDVESIFMAVMGSGSTKY
jgi:1-deoxy-D-xylulose-5-phosphate synthase